LAALKTITLAVSAPLLLLLLAILLGRWIGQELHERRDGAC
jgi:hypothetical protein